MNRLLTLALFLLVVVGGGLFIGFLTAPGQWYGNLVKPSFNPPAAVFGPVWTLLYILIALAGWRTFERSRHSWRMGLWWIQLALNFLWSPVFFGAHRIGLALLVIFGLFAAIAAFIVASWKQDRAVVWLFAPYAVWVLFASALNVALWRLN